MISVGADLTGQSLFTVKQSGSFTVPKSITVVSPTTQYLAKSLDTVRDVVGGEILMGFSDAASGSPGGASFIGVEVRPGDVIACSAVVANVITVSVNGVNVASVTGVTTVGGVIGFFN